MTRLKCSWNRKTNIVYCSTGLLWVGVGCDCRWQMIGDKNHVILFADSSLFSTKWKLWRRQNLAWSVVGESFSSTHELFCTISRPCKWIVIKFHQINVKAELHALGGGLPKWTAAQGLTYGKLTLFTPFKYVFFPPSKNCCRIANIASIPLNTFDLNTILTNIWDFHGVLWHKYPFFLLSTMRRENIPSTQFWAQPNRVIFWDLPPTPSLTTHSLLLGCNDKFSLLSKRELWLVDVGADNWQ